MPLPAAPLRLQSRACSELRWLIVTGDFPEKGKRRILNPFRIPAA